MLTDWLADSRYDSDTLDRTLQEAFDPDRRLFDIPQGHPAGARVVVTASRI